jgi:hypothetical protein
VRWVHRRDTIGFTCPGCGRVAVHPVTHADLANLMRAGVPVHPVDPFTPSPAPELPALTADDLIDWHVALDDLDRA